jgi:thioredoxin reductase
VKKYPGLDNITGLAVVAAMRAQAAHFGAIFADDTIDDANHKRSRLP